jgi:hypothetical protein
MKKIIVLFLSLFVIPAYADETVTVSSRSDATQSGLLIEADNAKAVVLLFPGGKGIIKLKDDGSFSKGKNNFLVRSRDLFVNNNMHVVVMDAPSDKQHGDGMKDGSFRGSSEHRGDIGAMVEAMQKRFKLPVWAIGTSRGTESVANAMVYLQDKLAGAVLTASMTEANDNGPTVREFDLDKVTIPVMVVHHENDECWVTTPHGAKNIAMALTASRRVELKMFSGGKEPASNECNARTHHGFYGIEQQVVDAIAEFILKG